MKIKDSFKLSLNSIAHRKLRAWLTLLGIIIGVAAVVSIISIGNGAQASVNASLSGFGADIITISPGFSRGTTVGGFGGGRGGIDLPGFGGGGGNNARESSTSTATPTLKDNDLMIIKSNPDVIAVNQIVSGRQSITFGDKKTNASIQGVNANTWTQTTNVTLSTGRFLNSSDTRNVVIGNSLATTTFSQPITLGRKIDINGTAFTVVGILALSGTGFGGGGTDSTIYMPYNAAWNVLDVNTGTYSSIQAKIKDATNADYDVNSLTQQLMISRRVTSRTQNFSVTSSQTLREQIANVTQTLTLFLGAIAAVSLLVGAVGIANSMFTSVLEKTRDIGIMKALGASNNEVLILFVIESGLFGFIGGLIGVMIAFLITGVMNLMGLSLGIGGRGAEMLITPELVIIAILISTLIGILAGIAPARNASKMRPVDALKYE
ncbi:MAG: ABC transporter permease [archaeon]|jgi:putative ABC transport system permease protein